MRLTLVVLVAAVLGVGCNCNDPSGTDAGSGGGAADGGAMGGGAMGGGAAGGATAGGSTAGGAAGGSTAGGDAGGSTAGGAAGGSTAGGAAGGSTAGGAAGGSTAGGAAGGSTAGGAAGGAMAGGAAGGSTAGGTAGGATGGGTADAGVPDAGAPGVDGGFLVGIYQGNLLHIDPDAVTYRLIGPTGVQTARPAWDRNSNVMRAVVNQYVAPQLAVIDRCTGQTTLGPRIQRVDGGFLPMNEAIVQAADGGFYVGTDWNGSNNFLSERIGTLDITTGVVTPLSGMLNTLQDDCDGLMLIEGELYTVDVQQPSSRVDLERVDPVTGMTQGRLHRLTTAWTRFAWDPERRLLFAFDDVTRNLAEIFPDGGARVRGVLIPDRTLDAGLNADGGGALDGFEWVPRPVCP